LAARLEELGLPGWLVLSDLEKAYDSVDRPWLLMAMQRMGLRQVGVGQTVARGQALGESGNTGRSTGPHLHYEVEHMGRNLDPTKALRPLAWR
jgi:hypothetical protein